MRKKPTPPAIVKAAVYAASEATRPEDDSCLIWQYTLRKGRAVAGGFGVNQRTVAHIIMELRGQPRPTPQCEILHSCDDPSCVAWWHLRWGTHQENVAQREERGRGKLPDNTARYKV